jgi:hypothetical protein
MSRPAFTQWCSMTELSAARAAGLRPNETFETPSEVSTPGSSPFDRRMPSIVSTADGKNSGSPVASVKVSASKIKRARRNAVFADDDVVDALRDLELALGGLRHARLVDRQRDDGRAALLDERQDRVDLGAAVSRFTELTIARPA